MPEIYWDRRGEMAIENMAGLLRQFPEHAERAMASALSSEGYRLKNLLQKAVAEGGVDGGWPKLNPHTGVLSRRRSRGGGTQTVKNYRMVWRGPKGQKTRVRQYRQVMLSKKQKPLARLRGGIRYQVDRRDMSVVVGFVNTRVRLMQLARFHAEGFSTPITPRMRKMFFAMGFPVARDRKYVTTPARPLVGPVFVREREASLENVRTKYLENVRRYMDEGRI